MFGLHKIHKMIAVPVTYTCVKPHYAFALPRIEHWNTSFQCITCKRHVSQAIYSQFLSPSSPPIGAAQSLLEFVHTQTGLPWWASLALTTAALRTVLTLPLMVSSVNNRAKVERLQPEIANISKQLATEVMAAQKKYEWDSDMAKAQFTVNMKRLRQKLYERDNCHPMREFILPWVQIPLWISMSLALRNMAGAFNVSGIQLPVLCPQMGREGALWFSNLLTPDTTLALPVSVCLLNLAIIQLHGLSILQPTRFQRVLSYTSHGLVLLMIPIGYTVPSCIVLYWAYSSLYGLVQFVVLRLPTVRRTLRMVPSSRDSDTPFRDMWQMARKKYQITDRSNE